MQQTMMTGESRLQANLFIISIVHSRKYKCLFQIYNVYNITKTSTAIQCPLNFNRIVVLIFGYSSFLRGKWEINKIVHEIS